MAQQTINIGASPNDGTGTPLRTAFQYTNSNFSELYTALGGGSGLPGSSGQVIFNDGGTNLAGDTGLTFNKTTDTLGTGRLTTSGDAIVCSSTGDFYVGTTLSPQFKVERATGSATITGDLTVDTNVLKVDTSLNRVGINNATPGAALHIGTTSGTNKLCINTAVTNSGDIQLKRGGFIGFSNAADIGNSEYIFANAGALEIGVNASTRFAIASDGVATWSNVGGVAGTAMTLNATGLGVGVSPSYKLDASATNNLLRLTSANGNDCNIVLTQSGVGNWMLYNAATNGQLRFQFGGNDRMIVDSSGNVGIGVTPSAWGAAFKVVQLRSGSLMADSGGTTLYNVQNVYFDGSNWLRINAAASTRYEQSVGVHSWWTGTSGSAGLSPTFTQAMTLDASGRLILLASTTTPATLSTNGQLTFTATSDTNLRFSYRGSDGVTRTADLTLA